MIDSIRLNNFKSHADTEISFSRLTALVGLNSSGKTTVLQAIHYMSQLISMTDGTMDMLFQGKCCPDVLCGKKKDAFNLIVRGHKKEQSVVIGIEFMQSEKRASASEPWSPKIFWNWGEWKDEIVGWNTQLPSTINSLTHVLQATYLKINSEKAASPSYTECIPPQVEYNGKGLASAVAYLMTYDSDRFHDLQKAMRKVVPALRRIRVRPARTKIYEKSLFPTNGSHVRLNETREVIGHELLFDMVGAEAVPAHSMGEGTLLVLASLTVFFSPNRSEIILLDDAEQGLHPNAQREFMQIIHQLLDSCEDLQIILATHSPYIVNGLDASEVWVLSDDRFGKIASCRLRDHPDAESALQILTGEAFLISGEGNQGTEKREVRV